jgi:hypothetical protein
VPAQALILFIRIFSPGPMMFTLEFSSLRAADEVAMKRKS